MNKATIKISIVVPTYNEQDNIAVLFSEIKKYLKDSLFEVIFIDDGSQDESLERIVTLARKQKEVKYLSFSRNFGHQAALRAGLRAAQGDAVVSMDADLQHPPIVLPELLSKWKEGYDVVYTVRQDTAKTGFLKRQSSVLFYKTLNFLSDLKIEEGAADFRLLDRKVVDVINAQNEADIFLRGYINWIGFKQIGIPYVPAERFSGTSKYTFKKMFSLAGKGVTQFSIKPLRLSFGLAFITFALCVAYLIYASIVALMGRAVSGWLSLISLFVFMEGIQFLLIGLVGEYLGRTFMQTKGRPEYIIAKKSNEE